MALPSRRHPPPSAGKDASSFAPRPRALYRPLRFPARRPPIRFGLPPCLRTAISTCRRNGRARGWTGVLLLRWRASRIRNWSHSLSAMPAAFQQKHVLQDAQNADRTTSQKNLQWRTIPTGGARTAPSLSPSARMPASELARLRMQRSAMDGRTIRLDGRTVEADDRPGAARLGPPRSPVRRSRGAKLDFTTVRNCAFAQPSPACDLVEIGPMQQVCREQSPGRPVTVSDGCIFSYIGRLIRSKAP